MPLLVLASQVDEVAERVLAALPPGSRRLTCRDLSRPGWRVPFDAPEQSVAVVDGDHRLAARDIEGVICLLPCVFEAELVHIEPEDRAYVAAEMTAFLHFWLDALSCPKLNPPTAGCLSGPAWRAERWAREAARAGLTVARTRRTTRSRPQPEAAPSPAETVTVTVVGRAVLGTDDASLRRGARALATRAGVELLGVEFARDNGGFTFAGVNLFPDLAFPAALEAVCRFFAGGHGP